MKNQTPIRAGYSSWRVGFFSIVLQAGLVLIFMVGVSLRAQTGADAAKTVNGNPAGAKVLTLTAVSGSGQNLRPAQLPLLKSPGMSVTLLEKVAAVVMLAGLLAFIGWFAQHTWIKSMEEEEIPFIPAHVPLVRLDRPLRAVRRVEETESFNLVAGSQQNQEKSAAFGLAVACPFDQGNPSACPLHEIRKRNLKDRYEWIQGLSEERTHQLLAYHQECLDGKKSLKKNPPIAICFEAPRRSRGLVIESVIRKVG